MVNILINLLILLLAHKLKIGTTRSTNYSKLQLQTTLGRHNKLRI